jgi:hypothetical protein
MPRLEWLVPVIVIVVYVIGWIIKAKEEVDAKAKKPAGKQPGQELDRFLEEIDRLRREQSSKQTPVADIVADEHEDYDRPAPVVIRPAPRPAPVLPQKPIIIRRPPRLVVETLPPPAPVVPITPAPLPLASRLSAAQPAKPASPASARRISTVAAVMGLLRNPRTVSSALILNEVLGPPKSKRR